MKRVEVQRDAVAAALLALFTLVLVWPGSGSTAVLAQGDELMHIATVRESVANGQWFLPIINGAPNYHKPPLLFWAGIASEHLFGASLWSARLPSVVFALLTVLCVFGVLRTFDRNRSFAFWTALLYAGTLGVFKFGRLLMMEQGLALASVGMLWAFAMYLRRENRIALLVSGTCAAVAYLFKGPLFQVYGVLMLATWASMILFRFRNDSKGVRRAGRARIVHVLRAAVIFHVPLLIPIVWAYFTYSRADAGMQLLEYFMIFENVSKFRESNQSELRLLSGWLLHTLPFTIVLFVGVIAALRDRVRSPRAFAGQVLIWTAVVWTLFHLVPNRKAMYYMLPALPGFIAGIALVIDLREMRRVLRANTIVLVVLLFVAGVLSAGLGGSEHMLWLPGALLAVIALLVVMIRRPRWSYPAAVAAGLACSVALQLGLVPHFHRTILPDSIRENDLARELCVVSPDTWDALAYRNLLPERAIVHAMMPEGCRNAGLGLPGIIVYESQETEPPAPYREIRTWPVWRDDLTFEDVWAGIADPQTLQRPIRYWDVERHER